MKQLNILAANLKVTERGQGIKKHSIVNEDIMNAKVNISGGNISGRNIFEIQSNRIYQYNNGEEKYRFEILTSFNLQNISITDFEKMFGIKIDCNNIITKHKTLITEYKNAKEKELKEKRKNTYKNSLMKEVIYVSLRKKYYNDSVEIESEEHFIGNDNMQPWVKVYFNYVDANNNKLYYMEINIHHSIYGPYDVSESYNYKTHRMGTVNEVLNKVDLLYKNWVHNIVADVNSRKAKEEADQHYKDELNYPITRFKAGRYDYSRKWVEYDKTGVFFKNPKNTIESDTNASGVVFSGTVDGNYSIQTIYGSLSPDTLKKIIKLVKEEANRDSYLGSSIYKNIK